MRISRWLGSGLWVVGLVVLRGTLAESAEAPSAVPQENFFSSIKQAFNQDFDKQVIRGHFDVGSPARRYYCLVDAKTGKRSPNAVPGEPAPRRDGMTGIKATAVSTYSCDSAEQQGILVTTGYILPAKAQTSAPPPPAPPPALSTPALPPLATSAERIDVAGIKLGMSPDEVREALKAKKLLNYFESAAVLGPLDTRYVNSIAAWTVLPGRTDGAAADRHGESFEVMFTPVPGKERVMAIVHSMAYLPSNPIDEASLDEALAKKYGGFKSGEALPESVTWRFQSDGSVQVGDACNRRGIAAGSTDFNPGATTKPNLALRTSVDEFQFQIQQCGVAIATEDHVTVKSERGRYVTRVTVSAYSPVLGLNGATVAAQSLATARSAVGDARPAPSL